MCKSVQPGRADWALVRQVGGGRRGRGHVPGGRAGGEGVASVEARTLGGRLALAAPVGVLRQPLQQLRVEELLQPLGFLVHLRVRLPVGICKRYRVLK